MKMVQNMDSSQKKLKLVVEFNFSLLIERGENIVYVNNNLV